MPVLWEELNADEIRDLDRDRTLLVLPVGAIEGHGSHLPTGTDWLTAVHVAEGLSERLDGVVILPGIPYGQCSSTRNFHGTIAVRPDSVRGIVHDILDQVVEAGFRHVMVMSSHAGSGHMAALRFATGDVVRNRGVRIAVVSDYEVGYGFEDNPEGDGHAGMMETSRMMVARPDLVGEGKALRTERSSRYIVRPDPEVMFPDGGTGDASAASRKFGEEVNDYIFERLLSVIEELMNGG